MLFIYNNLEEAARREFEQAGLHIKCVDGNRYLGVYFRPREDLESWGRPNVEAWAHGEKNVATYRVTVPAKDFTWGWNYNRSH